MNPLSSTKLNYNPEYFFPRINQEYRDNVRKEFVLEEIRYEFSEPDYYEVEEAFNIETPSYGSEGIDDIQAVRTGQKLDVITLLSSVVDHLVRCVCHGTDNNYNNDCEFVDVGVEESLNGKRYLLFVCVVVPLKWCDVEATKLAMLSTVSSELSSSHDDFEMVFVPMMRTKPDLSGYYGADAFHHFLTAFPNRLSVPFSSHRACDIMCRYLGFEAPLKAILIGPDHEVLSCFASMNVRCFGSDGYPFTKDRRTQLRKELPQLSLARLLGLDPDSRLRKFGSSSETVSIDHLSTKLVGIYLFKRGDMFTAINEVYQKCRDGLEIVLVFMPDRDSINPFVFQEEAHSILHKLGLGMSWWALPYDNSACCRLSTLTEDRGGDAIIIVDPSTGFPDPYGDQILSYWGMDAYPFTREALVQSYVDKAEQVTLQSLLCRESVDYVIKPDGGRMPVSQLKGKYVFLYVDWKLKSGFRYDILKEWYHWMKEHHSESDVEYVFVTYKEFEDFPPTEVPDCEEIPWSVYPSDARHSAFLGTHDAFFMRVAYEGKSVVNGLRPPGVLLVFGKDGHIQLINGLEHDPILPPSKNLRSQVIQKMRPHFDFMIHYH